MALQHNHTQMKIRKILQECEGIKMFELDGELEAGAGQFVMASIPDVSENPLTVAYDSPLRLIVQARGEDDGEKSFTKTLFGMHTGDSLQITGPSGNRFADIIRPDMGAYFVAGGCGAAALELFDKQFSGLGGAYYILGARSMKYIPVRLLRMVDGRSTIATDDGSYGIRGDILAAIESADIEPGGQAVVCGPRKMMIAAGDRLSKRMDGNRVVVSLEPYMKCGRGVCGSCEVDGYKACTDGPNFAYSVISDAKDFREYNRGKSGAPESL